MCFRVNGPSPWLYVALQPRVTHGAPMEPPESVGYTVEMRFVSSILGLINLKDN